MIAKVITNNLLLTGIDIGFNQLRSHGIIQIANALKELSCLRKVSFNDNQLDEDSADGIAAMIANNCGIVQLLLSNNQLKAIGTQKICKKLSQNTTLKLLGLRKIKFTEEAVGDILVMIENNPLFESIDASHSKLKSNGIVKIASALKN